MSSQQAQRFQHMLNLYQRYKRENGVLDPPQGYNHIRQVALNTVYDRFRGEALALLMLIVLLVGFRAYAKK